MAINSKSNKYFEIIKLGNCNIDNSGVIKLGNMFGATGGNYAGNVYDIHGEAPTVNTCGGGYREPIIVEVTDDR